MEADAGRTVEYPLISVITVTRNDIAGLKKTAECIWAQKFDGYEHIIVDGASTDGTVAWLESHKYGNLVRWVSEPDSGVYDAMNKGASMARGELVIFMNAGDAYRYDTVLRRIAESYAHERWMWYYSRALVTDDEYRPFRADYGLRRYSIYRHAYARAAVCHQAVAMRRELFFDLGGLQEKHLAVADYALLLRAGQRHKPRVSGSVDVFYLAGGLSSRNPHAQYEKHLARVDVFGYGALARRMDLVFSWVQALEIAGRRRLKGAAVRWGLGARLARWAGRRLR